MATKDSKTAAQPRILMPCSFVCQTSNPPLWSHSVLPFLVRDTYPTAHAIIQKNGRPIAIPYIQTRADRASHADVLGALPLWWEILIPQSHFPGVVPYLESSIASATSHSAHASTDDAVTNWYPCTATGCNAVTRASVDASAIWRSSSLARSLIHGRCSLLSECSDLCLPEWVHLPLARLRRCQMSSSVSPVTISAPVVVTAELSQAAFTAPMMQRAHRSTPAMLSRAGGLPSLPLAV